MKNNLEKKKTTPKKPKVKKSFRLTLPVMAGVTAAFAVSSLIAILLIFKMSGNPLLTSYEDIELPNFVGMTEGELKNSEYKLKYNIEYVFSADQEQGVIVSQAPKPPKEIKENSTITLKVSKGPDNTPMPDLINYSRSDAEKILGEMDVNVTIVTQSNKDVKVGYIIKTEPEKNTMVATGSTVTIYVSRGDDDDKNKAHVPNVVGLTSLDEAKKVLAKNSLRVGSFISRYDGSPAGTVLEQTPAVGVELILGGSVDLVISLGPEPTPVPTCPICGTTEHITHPDCQYCGNNDHQEEDCIKKPCEICGSTEHKTGDHVDAPPTGGEETNPPVDPPVNPEPQPEPEA